MGAPRTKRHDTSRACLWIPKGSNRAEWAMLVNTLRRYNDCTQWRLTVTEYKTSVSMATRNSSCCSFQGWYSQPFSDLLQNLAEKLALRDTKHGSVFPGPKQSLSSQNMKRVRVRASSFSGDDVLQNAYALDQVVVRVLAIAVFVSLSHQEVAVCSLHKVVVGRQGARLVEELRGEAEVAHLYLQAAALQPVVMIEVNEPFDCYVDLDSRVPIVLP